MPDLKTITPEQLRDMPERLAYGVPRFIGWRSKVISEEEKDFKPVPDDIVTACMKEDLKKGLYVGNDKVSIDLDNCTSEDKSTFFEKFGMSEEKAVEIYRDAMNYLKKDLKRGVISDEKFVAIDLDKHDPATWSQVIQNATNMSLETLVNRYRTEWVKCLPLETKVAVD